MASRKWCHPPNAGVVYRSAQHPVTVLERVQLSSFARTVKGKDNPLNKISEADLGWLAAIMDAKGKITTKTNPARNTPQLVLRVCTTDKRIAERLSRLTGTSPEPHEFTRFSGDIIRRGCKEHCPQPHIHVEESLEPLPQGTEWRLTGLSMAIVLWNLRKYMTRYPDFAGYVGVAYRNAVTTGRGSGQVRVSVKRLRELGWRIPVKITRELVLEEARGESLNVG